ncbi:hypothetical protein ACROYT_G011070 [Oculina patagonica]
MLFFSSLFLLTSTISVCPSLANSQNQFWCSLPGVGRCVDNANNLTECNCTSPNQTYCPSNSSCQASASYNESLCWNNVSCPIAPTTVTANNLASGNGAVSIVPTASVLVSASTSVADSHVSTTPTPTTFHPLDTDYTPIIISVAAGFACFIVYVCCMCLVHSWWLKRNKFTEVNSTPLKDIEKKRRKEELRELRRQRKEAEAKEPSRFDMGYRKPQKVNERAMANYDWARTSYLPGMLEPSAHEPNPAESAPKLICDDDDTEFDNPKDLGDENIGYESGQEHEDEPRYVSTPSSLFAPVEMEPQEPVMVEPEIFESMEEIPRPPPDGVMEDTNPPRHSQDYFNMMGRF